MSEFPEELLPSKMFSQKTAPVLWIGSGLSKRFVKGFKDWDGLLKEASSKVGITEGMYVSIKMRARKDLIENATDVGDVTDDLVLAETASRISKNILDKMSNGDLDPKTFFSEKSYSQFIHETDPLKLIICDCMESIEFIEDKNDEIESFKKLSRSIPAVITTNYDTVIEDLFGDGYKVFNSTDEYYRNAELGIGEIHKIHGTVKMPRSLVITTGDYELFKKRASIISSRIISLMCDSPLLVMGYSMKDWIAKDVIEKMISSFSHEKASEICQNIICVKQSNGKPPHEGSMMVTHHEGQINVRVIHTDDFLPLFKDLANYEQELTIPQVRKLRKMLVRTTRLSVPEEQKRLAYFGIEDIDDVDPNRTVIALTTGPVLATMRKAYSSYTLDEIINDVLTDKKLEARSMIDIWFENNKMAASTFIPIFDYLIYLKRDNQLSKKMRNYIEFKKSQYDKEFLQLSRTHSNVVDKESFEKRMNDSSLKFKRADLIMFAYHKDIIPYDTATDYLKKHFESTKKENNGKSDTSIKRSVTYLGFKRYMDGNPEI